MKLQLSIYSILLCLFANSPAANKNLSQATTVTVIAEGTRFHGNELSLHLFGNEMFNDYPFFKDESSVITAKGTDNVYRFIVPVNGLLDYFSLAYKPAPGDSSDLKSMHFWPLFFLLEPGDAITVTVKPGTGKKGSWERLSLSFSGKGSAKLQCAAEIEYAIHSETRQVQGNLLDEKNRPYENYWADVFREARMEMLAKHRAKLSPAVYRQLEFDAKTNEMYKKYVAFRNTWLRAKGNLNKRDSLRESYKKYFVREPDAAPVVKLQSPYYPDYFVEKNNCDYLVLQNGKGGASNMYRMIKSRFTGELRQKMISKFFLYNIRSITKWDSLLVDAAGYVKDEPYLEIVDGFLRNGNGKPAFSFVLQDSLGNIHRLKDLTGKVVFIDFWFTGCGPCMDYYKKVIEPAEEHFKADTNVVFVSINVDANRDKWLKGLRTWNYSSAKAVNLFTNGEGSDHPLVKNYRFDAIGFPQQLMIDAEGRVAGGYIINKKETLIEAISAVKGKLAGKKIF